MRQQSELEKNERPGPETNEATVQCSLDTNYPHVKGWVAERLKAPVLQGAGGSYLAASPRRDLSTFFDPLNLFTCVIGTGLETALGCNRPK
jgi:hypothetical protein